MSSFGEEGRAAQDKAAAGGPHSVTDEPEAFQLFPTDGGGGLDSVSVLSTFDPVLWSGDEGAHEDVARKLVGDVDPIFVRSWGRPRMDGRDTKKTGAFSTHSVCYKPRQLHRFWTKHTLCWRGRTQPSNSIWNVCKAPAGRRVS